jgi:hypothetical protein
LLFLVARFDLKTRGRCITPKLEARVTSVTLPLLHPDEARALFPVYTEITRSHSRPESDGKDKYACTYHRNQISHPCERGNKTILKLNLYFSDSRWKEKRW